MKEPEHLFNETVKNYRQTANKGKSGEIHILAQKI